MNERSRWRNFPNGLIAGLASNLGLLLLTASVPATLAQTARLDATEVAKASGANPTIGPDGVVRIGWSREDVAVRISGWALKPFAGLGSWAAFKPFGQGALLMGDTVVFSDEVDPAMDAAFGHGLEVTALHNHFFFDEPPVFFMHIGGHGEPEKLAAGVKAVWDAIKAVRAKAPEPASGFPGGPALPGALDPTPIEAIFGHPAAVQDGVVKVTVGREGSMHGVTLGGSMGLTTWMAFSGSDERAAVCGDFIMRAVEVQPVLRELRRQGIHPVALHNHMMGEAPPYYFAHFWGEGPAPDLARRLKAALDVQGQVP